MFRVFISQSFEPHIALKVNDYHLENTLTCGISKNNAHHLFICAKSHSFNTYCTIMSVLCTLSFLARVDM